MSVVKLEKIEKVYPNGFKAVHGVDLDVKDGEFMVLVGPSGCAKSTVLRMIAGLEEITEGTLRIGDKIVNDVDPKDRGIAMVFQNYALYPHMTVYNNMAFGLKLRKMPKKEIDIRVREAAAKLEIEDLLVSY
jgi:multiple sugar transport system ATP-binding protein